MLLDVILKTSHIREGGLVSKVLAVQAWESEFKSNSSYIYVQCSGDEDRG